MIMDAESMEFIILNLFHIVALAEKLPKLASCVDCF
jgi:hypothetical protein